MSDGEPIELHHRHVGATAGGHEFSPASAPSRSGSSRWSVFFNRRELDTILRVYGHKVAAGEWRDYAIDQTGDEAIFSVFRRTSEMPLYRIVKAPKDARRQGAYRVISASGMILKRGHDLTQVLRAIQKRRLKLVGA